MSNLDDSTQRLHQAAQKARRDKAQAERERQREKCQRRELDRQAANLLNEAKRALEPFRSRLLRDISQQDPREAGRTVSRDTVSLHGVELSVPEPTRSDGFSPEWTAKLFKVCATSSVTLRRAEENTLMAASLWHCDAEQAEKYRWYQIAFTTPASLPNRRQLALFDLDPSDQDAPLSLVATHPVVPLSFEAVNEDTFTARWTALFASALEGRLDKWPDKRKNRIWRRG